MASIYIVMHANPTASNSVTARICFRPIMSQLVEHMNGLLRFAANMLTFVFYVIGPFICMSMEKDIKNDFRSGLANYLKAGEENHKRRGSCPKHAARRWRTKNGDMLPLARMPTPNGRRKCMARKGI